MPSSPKLGLSLRRPTNFWSYHSMFRSHRPWSHRPSSLYPCSLALPPPPVHSGSMPYVLSNRLSQWVPSEGFTDDTPARWRLSPGDNGGVRPRNVSRGWGYHPLRILHCLLTLSNGALQEGSRTRRRGSQPRERRFFHAHRQLLR